MKKVSEPALWNEEASGYDASTVGNDQPEAEATLSVKEVWSLCTGERGEESDLWAGPAEERVLARVGKTLTDKVLQIAPRRGHYTVVLEVAVHEGRIEFGKASLTKPAPVPAHSTFDPYEAGRRAIQDLQEVEGGAWVGHELEQRFKLTAATLHRRRAEHRIVWWKDARNQFHYPRWQFDPAGALLPGLQQVLQIFRSTDPWRVMRYFLGARAQLNERRPLDLLRAGDVEAVMSHARAHAAEDTW